MLCMLCTSTALSRSLGRFIKWLMPGWVSLDRGVTFQTMVKRLNGLHPSVNATGVAAREHNCFVVVRAPQRSAGTTGLSCTMLEIGNEPQMGALPPEQLRPPPPAPEVRLPDRGE